VARAGVPTVLEDPPGGGPVAALAAGLAALSDGGTWTGAGSDPTTDETPAPSPARRADAPVGDRLGPTAVGAGATEGGRPGPTVPGAGPPRVPDVVVVLACDVPRAGRAVAALVTAAAADGVDGARLVAADGSAQPLVAAYRRGPLTAALDALDSTHGVSMRRALAGLRLVDVPDRDDAALDADTWDDVARLRRAPWWHDREDGSPEPADARPGRTDPAAPTDGARR
jgi:molybdopterin-guanine dinucleotide biosynthesis protein A